jgi:hypothetical protein
MRALRIRVRVASLLVLMLAARVSVAQRPATIIPTMKPGPPLRFDSTHIRKLLDDAFAAAAAAPRSERATLLNALGSVALRMGDFARVEQVLALDVTANAIDVSHALGQAATFTWLDRSTLATRFVCGLHAAGRRDEALAAVHRMQPGPEREWQLARFAANVASSRDSISLEDPLRYDRALAIAREIQLRDARLDAMISIAMSAADSSREAIALAAFDDARRIRLDDADRQSDRTALLVGIAGRLRRTDDARILFATLDVPDDLLEAVSELGRQHARVELLRELAPRAIGAAASIRDSAARTSVLATLHERLKRAIGPAADGLFPADVVRSPRRIDPDSAEMRSTVLEDVARRALEHGTARSAETAIDGLPSRDSTAVRASLLSDLAWSVYPGNLDAGRQYLVRARDALMASGARPEQFDRIAVEIADRQFYLGDEMQAVETMNAMHFPSVAAQAAGDLGHSTVSHSDEATLRTLIARLKAPETQDAIRQRLVTILTNLGDTSTLRRVRALADSLGSPAARASARIALTNRYLALGDSADAHRDALLLLVDSVANAHDAGRSLMPQLIALGEADRLEAWAHDAAPAERVRRLIAVAEVYFGQVRAKVNWVDIPAYVGSTGCSMSFAR